MQAVSIPRAAAERRGMRTPLRNSVAVPCSFKTHQNISLHLKQNQLAPDWIKKNKTGFCAVSVFNYIVLLFKNTYK